MKLKSNSFFALLSHQKRKIKHTTQQYCWWRVSFVISKQISVSIQLMFANCHTIFQFRQDTLTLEFHCDFVQFFAVSYTCFWICVCVCVHLFKSKYNETIGIELKNVQFKNKILSVNLHNWWKKKFKQITKTNGKKWKNKNGENPGEKVLLLCYIINNYCKLFSVLKPFQSFKLFFFLLNFIHVNVQFMDQVQNVVWYVMKKQVIVMKFITRKA